MGNQWQRRATNGMNKLFFSWYGCLPRYMCGLGMIAESSRRQETPRWWCCYDRCLYAYDSRVNSSSAEWLTVSKQILFLPVSNYKSADILSLWCYHLRSSIIHVTIGLPSLRSRRLIYSPKCVEHHKPQEPSHIMTRFRSAPMISWCRWRNKIPTPLLQTAKW